MPRQIVENTVSRSFDISKTSLLENIIEYIEDKEVIEDDDGKPPNANCGDLL